MFCRSKTLFYTFKLDLSISIFFSGSTNLKGWSTWLPWPKREDGRKIKRVQMITVRTLPLQCVGRKEGMDVAYDVKSRLFYATVGIPAHGANKPRFSAPLRSLTTWRQTKGKGKGKLQMEVVGQAEPGLQANSS